MFCTQVKNVNTPDNVVAWYQREFSLAITSKEYRAWAEQNFILVAESELNPLGVSTYSEDLHKAFAPIIKQIKIE